MMDIILYNIVFVLGALLIGYFLGSIPNGIIIGKLFFKRDPRLEGSGNSGGTNVGRVFGKPAGIACILLDMIKGVIAMIVVWAIVKFTSLESLVDYKVYNQGNTMICMAGLGAIIGHCYPIYAGFKGGKAVATFCGLAITCWALIVPGLIVFFTTLKCKKYVSLSSMLLSVFSAIFSWVVFITSYIMPNTYQNYLMIGNGNFVLASWEYATLMTIGMILVIARHIPNIKRLKNGTESKIKWMK